MNLAEFEGAQKGQWADSPFVAGDEMGHKWLWDTEDAAQGWLQHLQHEGGESGIITEVPTAKPITDYPSFEHLVPPGNAIHVPIEDLGPARPLK